MYPEAREYLAYVKSKYPAGMLNCDKYYAFGNHPDVWTNPGLQWYFLKHYYKLRGNDDVRFSTGMGMIICALERFRPKTLILAGFDSIINPETDWSSTLSQKEYDWENSPPHDFAAEHKFLETVKSEYSYSTIEVMP